MVLGDSKSSAIVGLYWDVTITHYDLYITPMRPEVPSIINTMYFGGVLSLWGLGSGSKRSGLHPEIPIPLN